MLKKPLLAASAALAAVFSAVPAFAFDTEEYSRAAAVFLGKADANGPADYLLHAPKAIMSGLNGSWAAIPPVPSGDVGALLPKLCERMSVTFGGFSDTGFTESQGGGKVVTRYTVWTGNAFVKSTPPEQIYARLGFDKQPPSDKLELTKQTANRLAQGIASMYRPSPDILVIQTNYSVPTLYVRCP